MRTTSAKRNRAHWAGGACVAALILASAAAAQQTQPATSPPPSPGPGGATQLEEITVTAQKQSENVQKVPISITAVSGATVAAAHTANLEALQGAVPDVQIGHFSNNPTSAVFNIRGMGVIEADPYAGSTVGVVVDGIPQFFNMISLPVIYDLDRIEVLRGPQGTLFGANTIGGVINVISSQPTGQYGGTASLTYGNYHRLDGEATINFPIIEDKLAGKLAFYHDGVDGYVTNVVNGEKMGDQDWTSIRAYLKWTPTSNFDATLQGGYTGARNGGPIVVNGSVPGEVEYVPAGTILPGDVMGQYASPCPPSGGHCSAPSTYYAANSSVPDTENVDIYSVTLTANWKTSIGKLTSITGYETFTDDNWTDQDGTVEFLDDTHRYTKGWQFSEELRDSFNPLPGVKVLIGGFFMDDHYFQFQNFRVNFASVRQYNTQDQDNRSGSLFVQTYWDLTPKLRLQVGVRGTTEYTQMTAGLLDYFYSGPVQFTGGTLLASTPNGPSIPPETGAKTWNNLGGKVGLDYQWTPNLMTYAYYARGFKSGGFVGRIGIPSDLGPYNPEYVDTYEVGVKSDWFDRRLRADLALFYNNYRNLQVAEIYFVGATQGNSILNAATARTEGAEFELTARPVQGLSLNASVAYLDARYTKFMWPNPNNGGALQSLTGYPLNDAPAWTASGGASYVIPTGPGHATLGLSTRFTGSKYEEAIDDSARSYVQPTLYFDGTLDWQPTEDSQWSIELWARNLSDRHYIASVYDAPGTLGLVNYAPPRMYGATFKVRW